MFQVATCIPNIITMLKLFMTCKAKSSFKSIIANITRIRALIAMTHLMPFQLAWEFEFSGTPRTLTGPLVMVSYYMLFKLAP